MADETTTGEASGDIEFNSSNASAQNVITESSPASPPPVAKTARAAAKAEPTSPTPAPSQSPPPAPQSPPALPPEFLPEPPGDLPQEPPPEPAINLQPAEPEETPAPPEPLIPLAPESAISFEVPPLPAPTQEEAVVLPDDPFGRLSTGSPAAKKTIGLTLPTFDAGPAASVPGAEALPALQIPPEPLVGAVQREKEEAPIVFNAPPLPAVETSAAAPEQAPREKQPTSLAEEVGLKITGPSSIHNDIQKMLEEVQLPSSAIAIDAPAAPEVIASQAPPVGAPPPELVLPEAPAPEPLPPPEPPKKERPVVVSLHTMKDDLAEAVATQRLSAVRVASLEADRRATRAPKNEPLPEIARAKRPAAPRNRRAVLLIGMIFVCIVLGAAALFAAYLVTQKQTSVPVASTGILFAEQQTALPLGSQGVAGIKQTLSSMLTSQSGGAGSILQITPVILGASGQPTRKATLEEFLRAMGAKAPDDLLRSISNDFFFGIHAADAPSAVFVIPVTSYDHAFAGMLAWERTMDQDLAPLFRQVNPYTTNGSTTTEPVARTFEDAVMRNYDVRVLRDDDGSVALYYSFPSPSLLIIASSPYTFPEVLSRLQAARKL